MSEIKIRGLKKSYGPVPVIHDLDLTVQEGEFLSLLGPSGCGKTTTLRCVAGLEDPTGGQISIGGDTVVDAGRNLFVPPYRRGLGMVFQSYALWPHMTVFGNVAYPLSLQRRPNDEIRRRVNEVLEIVGLAHLAGRGTGELSGGQQQRIALARAIAGNPRVLLLDEPLSNLDASLRGHMRRELRRIHREIRRTSIYVTHDQLEAVTLSDRIVVLNKGRVEQIGTPREIFGAPANRWVAEFVGFDNFIAGKVEDSGSERISIRPDGWAQAIVCARGGSAKPATGSTAFAAIRSSSFHATPQPGGTEIDAVIVEATYVGDMMDVSLNAAGVPLATRFPDQASIRPGSPVKVHLAAGQAIALAD